MEKVSIILPTSQKTVEVNLDNYMPDWKERKRILDQEVVHGL